MESVDDGAKVEESAKAKQRHRSGLLKFRLNLHRFSNDKNNPREGRREGDGARGRERDVQQIIKIKVFPLPIPISFSYTYPLLSPISFSFSFSFSYPLPNPYNAFYQLVSIYIHSFNSVESIVKI